MAMRKDLVGHLMALEKTHGPIWRVAIGRGGMISMLGPDALEFVWKNRDGAQATHAGPGRFRVHGRRISWCPSPNLRMAYK
jgi:hypothetical protein